MSGMGGGWRGIAVPLFVLVVGSAGCSPPDAPPARSRAGDTADIRLRTELEPRIAEYFHLRKRAMLDGSAEVLWRRYPALRRTGSPGAGINAEGLHVGGWKGVRLIDGDILPEAGERLVIDSSADTAAVHVRGMESYLRADFGRSAWELRMTLVFRHVAGRWELVQTDEVTDAERHAVRH